MKLDDKQVLHEFYELMKSKFISDKKRKFLNEYQILDSVCLDLRKLCLNLDSKKEGTIKSEEFLELLEKYFPEMSANKMYYLQGMAE